MVTKSELERALRASWCRETSSGPSRWSPENPAWGQCAVTALIVQDYLGGKIVNAAVPSLGIDFHYFNLIDGKEIDFTRCQFPPGTEILSGVPETKEFPTVRDSIFSHESMDIRYELLKELVERNLS